MPQVSSTMNCCGTYQLTGLQNAPTKNELNIILERLKQSGLGHLPVVVLFADGIDKGENKHPGISTGGGEKWAEFLREEGYPVEEFEIGKNPKSGNYLKFFMWFPTKTKKVSKRTVLLRKTKNENESTSTAGASVGIIGRTGGSRIRRILGR